MTVYHPPSTHVDVENLFGALHPAVTPKWKQLVKVLKVDEDLIDEIFNNNEMDEECLKDILKNILKDILKVWIKNSSPTWKNVTDVLWKFGEDQLAESLYVKRKTQ